MMAALLVTMAGCGTGTAADAPGPGDAARGESVFNENCSACHGIAAVGTDSGPPLVHDLYLPGHHADFAFTSAVRNGVRAHHWSFGSMPSIPGVSDLDIADIVAYVRGLQRAAGLLED